MAQTVSYLSPWTGRVQAKPTEVASGGNPGSFTAVVSVAGNLNYPSAVEDCASYLKITLPPLPALPPLTAKGAKGTWAVEGPISTTSDTSVTLDAHGSNTLNYKTDDNGGCSDTTGPKGNQYAYATITVPRTGVTALQDLANNWLSGLPGLAGAAVKPILQPLLASISAKIATLTQISASGHVLVTASKTGSSSDKSCLCIFGSWRVTLETISQEDVSGGQGTTWEVTPDGTDDEAGTTVVNYDSSMPLSNSEISISYRGVETDKFTLPEDTSGTSGTWDVHAVSSSVTAQVDVAGSKGARKPVTFGPKYVATGSWSCSGNNLKASYGGTGETVELART